MGKISQVSSKYIVHVGIEIEGVVDRPDVIGAIFGQTEGLLGNDLELRELQRSGRIGRIEVNVDTSRGKTQGVIVVPSSLDKTETSIIAAAMETIQRIGPCNAKIRVQKVEDVRVSKRNYVITRAKELLKGMMDQILPDSQEISDEVAYSVRVMEITEYGKERLPAGPGIDDSDEIIIVEGRADVLNLLKHGFKNAIAMGGTGCPQSLVDLCKKKEVTVFVDGDRGGNLIIKELMGVTEIDFVTKAPDGKEVEEITKKEIHKAIRSRIPAEQAKTEMAGKTYESSSRKISSQLKRQPLPPRRPMGSNGARPAPSNGRGPARAPPAPRGAKKEATPAEKKKFKTLVEGLVGTRGACLLDEKLNVLGKVPMSELSSTVDSLKSGIYAIMLDGAIDKTLCGVAEKGGVKHLAGMDSKVRPGEVRVNVMTINDL